MIIKKIRSLKETKTDEKGRVQLPIRFVRVNGREIRVIEYRNRVVIKPLKGGTIDENIS